MSSEGFIGTCVVLLGLVLGSAVTALSWRLPRGQSWVHGRSRCPGCGHVLGFLDLFPVLSWLANRGRCRHCGARVSFRYPLIELTCGVWALLAWLKLGLAPAFPLVLLWGCMLVTLLWIDIDFHLLPDALTLPGTLIGVAIALLGPGARHAMFGMIVGAGYLWLVGFLWERLFQREAMGGGDLKLAAMFGAVLGPAGAFMTISIGAVLGSLWGGLLIWRGRGTMKSELPFGATLCPAALVTWLWGDALLHAYLASMGR